MVDTPDWFQSERSPEEVKAQISSFVALSAPGPHVFLLCVPVDRPARSELSALSALEAAFGPDAVRRHTIVLFTRSELLPDAAAVEQVEAYIASQRPEMLELVQRCGDRYHVLQSSGGAELLEKVQQTVKESGGDFYSTSLVQQNQTPTVKRDRDRPNPSLLSGRSAGGRGGAASGLGSGSAPLHVADCEPLRQMRAEAAGLPGL